MNEHILNLLAQRQYSEEVKEEAIVRVLFNGESVVDVAGGAMEINNVHTINFWVTAYRRK